MAAQIAHDVVKEAQSVGDASLIDDTANSNVTSAGNGQAQPTLDNLNGDTASTVDGAKQENNASAVDGPQPRASLAVVDDTIEVDSAGDGVAPHQAAADLSGGSDTDTSKADSLDQTKGPGKGHMRSNSVKKPAAFKSVSVTKNFLAKAATTAPNARSTDKGSPQSQSGTSTPLGARPRLVAKTALSASGSRSGLSKLNGSGGPDPMKVWNKNRPAPPPPPRQFTDEELKQQYGIHMATRLKADDSGESKWADIDDDEDDWAPETVEWVDGTKSNVAAHAMQTPPVEAKKPAVIPQPEEAPSPRPAPGAVQPPTIMPSTKTILKPGAHVASQSRSPGLGGRSPSDKPALTAKSPAPLPVKNPWAPLPPIDKVAPVFPNPPQPSMHIPFRRDPHGFDSLPPPPGPTREIAADDFNRSWRDDRGPRERALFNSRSGGYEPVNEVRRGSMREEYGYRQPSVLQRPLHSDRPAPAEPSAAFQTHRSSAESSTWGRRRTSSNVSSGGGRRPSFTRALDGAEGMSPTSGAILDSPQQANASLDRGVQVIGPGQGWQRTPSIYHQQGQIVAPDGLANSEAPASEPLEDPVQLQQRLMREKLAAARLTKQKEIEEEKREEAARKERLKAKMEALAGATPSPELKETGPKETIHSAPRSPLPPKVAPGISPPKPPIPTADGEVAQYGVMKVHQPHPVKRSVVSEASLTSKAASKTMAEPPHTAAVARQAQLPVDASGTISSMQGIEASTQIPPREQPTTTNVWRPSATHSVAVRSWGSTNSPAYASPGSVWGPPQSGERGLGNGTFTSYNTRRDITHESSTEATMGQIAIVGGTDHPYQKNSAAAQFQKPSLAHSEPSLTQPLHASLQSQPAQQNSPNQPFQLSSSSNLPSTLFSPNPPSSTPSSAKMGFEPTTPTEGSFPENALEVKPASKPAAPAAPQYAKVISGPGMKPIFGKRSTTSQWQEAPALLRAADLANAAKNRAERDIPKAIQPLTLNVTHTFKGRSTLNTFTNEPLLEQSNKVREIETSSSDTTAIAPLVAHSTAAPADGKVAVQPAAAKKLDAAPVPPKISKFASVFNTRADNIQPSIASANGGKLAPSLQLEATSSDCPPPDCGFLFADQSSHIKVKLPVRPVVKLPTADQYSHLKSSNTAQAKPIHSEDIIAKIHNICRTGASADRGVSGVSAITKKALDVEPRRPAIALPRNHRIITLGGRPFVVGTQFERPKKPDAGPVTKPDGDKLFEEPQFASRPLVRVPKAQPVNAHLPPTHIDLGRANPRYAVTDAQSQTLMDIAPVTKGGAMTVTAKLPGAAAGKQMTMRTPVRARPQGGSKPAIRGNGRRVFGGRPGNNAFGGNGNKRLA